MYKTRSQLKQDAKRALAGKWGLATPMALIIIITNVTLSTNTGNGYTLTILPLIGAIIGLLLSVGYYSFFLKLHCGQKDKTVFYDLFYGFRCNSGKALLLYLLLTLYMLPGTFIYIIGISIFVFVIYASAGVSMELMMTGTVPVDIDLMLAVAVMVLVMTLLYIVYVVYIDTTYSLVYFLLLDYPDLSVTEIWKKSKQLMRGNRLRLIGLDLSFFPWIFLTALSMGVGLLWLMPYMYSTTTAFYLDLVQNQTVKKQTATVPNQPFSYEMPNQVSDTNMTHDCETAHPETQAKDVSDYSGIDQETFK